MKKIQLIKDIVIDFGGLVQTTLYIIGGVSWLRNKMGNASLALKVAVYVATTFLIIFIMRMFSIVWSKITEAWLEERIESDIEELTKKTKENILKLPTTEQLIRWEQLLCDKAKKWEKNLKKSGMTLFIEHNNERTSINGQSNFVSGFLGQKLTLHTNSKSAQKKYLESYEEGESNVSFFRKYKEWDTAVYMAYKHIRNRLLDTYDLVIYSHYPNLHMRFTYKEGDVQKQVCYESDGEYLITPNGDKFPLKVKT